MSVCRQLCVAWTLAALVACRDTTPPVAPLTVPRDAAHQGITTPHGDHTPYHGGLVLMNGDLHYEVVLDPTGRHQVWFTDAVRQDLPASVASDVVLTITRLDGPPERLPLAIDDAGESWTAQGRPVSGENVMVKVMYSVRGTPHEVEIPFTSTRR